MGTEELGIENLKEAAAVGIEFGMELEDVLEDGAVDLAEGLSLAVGHVPAIYNEIVKDWKLLVAEFKDRSREEIDELVAYVAEQNDLENDGVELAIEDFLAAGAAVDKAQKSIRDLLRKE